MSWNCWNANTKESYGHWVSGLRFDLSLRCSSFQAQQWPNPQCKSSSIYKKRSKSTDKQRDSDRQCFFHSSKQTPAKLKQLSERERERQRVLVRLWMPRFSVPAMVGIPVARRRARQARCTCKETARKFTKAQCSMQNFSNIPWFAVSVWAEVKERQ